jgi:membrane associated rhomboid family serine protease
LKTGSKLHYLERLRCNGSKQFFLILLRFTQMSTKKQPEEKQSKLILAIIPALTLLGVMWAIWLLSTVNIIAPGSWGVVPRTISGAWGIVTAPLVHGGISHLFSNTLPFFFLLSMIFFFYRKVAYEVLIAGWLITGLAVWIGARSSSHIGASGLVYCFAAFMFFIGVFRREVGSMALSLLVVLLYGGMVWGVLPIQQGVSWESHLFGAITGASLAWVLKDKGKPERKKYSWENEPENPEEDSKAIWNFSKAHFPPKEIE